MVVVDRLSKYCHFIPLRHPFTAVTVAKAFVFNVVKLHGIPQSIVSDRDKIFVSSFWSTLFKLQGTELKMSSRYHPQTDGQTEVVNRILEQYLHCFTADQPTKWIDCLHSTTKMTPFEVVYGTPPPTLLPYVPGTTQVQAVEEYLSNRTTVLKELKRNLTLAQERMKKQADRGRREVQFEVGDFVYLKLHPYRQSSVAFRKSMKLSPRFFGPFEVLNKIGRVAYRITLPPGAQIHDIVHVSLLRKHLGDRPPALPSLPPVSDESTVLPMPEKVLDRRVIQKGKYHPRTEVLIKWAGDSVEDATWEHL
ncbi:hypothetical protein ACOSP7_012820 [Xanthoceras sorbifolium]